MSEPTFPCESCGTFHSASEIAEAGGYCPQCEADYDERKIIADLVQRYAALEAELAKLREGREPYAIECGFDNGDGTYSVRIKRMPLPSYEKPHKDWPVRLLYASSVTKELVMPDVAALQAEIHSLTVRLENSDAVIASIQKIIARLNKGGPDEQ